MKQLKPRDKVTQHMTRDGLTARTTRPPARASTFPAGRPNRTIPQPSRAAPLKRCWNVPGTSGSAARRSGPPRMARIRQRRPPAPRPACNSPPRNGPIPPFPSTFTRRKSGRISWTQSKKPCRKSASSPRKPSMTRPRARPKPSCTLTRWRNRPQAQTQPGQPSDGGSGPVSAWKNP
mgnify:CR=1 FL=1